MKSYLTNFVILLIFFAPFYYTTAWSDWRFTFFDVVPEQTSVTIDHGFGKGIKTNPVYRNLYEWISMNAEKYTKKDDFIISYVVSPMVYMIAKRRPSLDDTFTDFGTRPVSYYEAAIEKMKKTGRDPKMAFVFERMPILLPTSLKNPRYSWPAKQFAFPSKDPISRYIIENMKLVQGFKLADGNIVRCFVNTKMIQKEKIDNAIAKLQGSLNNTPEDFALYNKLAALYIREGKLDKAIDQYQKAISIRPESIQVLSNLAVLYADRKEYDKAVSSLKRIIQLRPNNADTYYNIACVFARQNKVNESVHWLKEAINRGFKNCDLLKTDRDLENIRGSLYYKELMRECYQGSK